MYQKYSPFQNFVLNVWTPVCRTVSKPGNKIIYCQQSVRFETLQMKIMKMKIEHKIMFADVLNSFFNVAKLFELSWVFKHRFTGLWNNLFQVWIMTGFQTHKKQVDHFYTSSSIIMLQINILQWLIKHAKSKYWLYHQQRYSQYVVVFLFRVGTFMLWFTILCLEHKQSSCNDGRRQTNRDNWGSTTKALSSFKRVNHSLIYFDLHMKDSDSLEPRRLSRWMPHALVYNLQIINAYISWSTYSVGGQAEKAISNIVYLDCRTPFSLAVKHLSVSQIVQRCRKLHLEVDQGPGTFFFLFFLFK